MEIEYRIFGIVSHNTTSYYETKSIDMTLVFSNNFVLSRFLYGYPPRHQIRSETCKLPAEYFLGR